VFEREQEQNQSNILGQTENAQPAIGTFSVGLYKILQQAGFQPDFVAGHSFGELTALWASGVLSDRDYFFLTKARGQAMSSSSLPQGDLGKMLAVQGKIKVIERAIADFPGVGIVNWNSPQQVVLGGSSPDILGVKQFLEQKNYRVTLLSVSAAFHTNLVGHAQGKFAQAVSQVKFQTPKIPVYSNTTTRPYPQDVPGIKQQLLNQMLNPVRFQEEIEQIYGGGGSIFVEFGPRSILTHLVRDILADKPHIAVALNPSRSKDSDRSLREAIIKLRVTGLKLSNCDRQQSESPAAPVSTKSGLTLKVSGCNYGSQQQQDKFLAALKDNQTAPRVDSLATENAPPELPTPKLSPSQAIAKSQLNMTKQQANNNSNNSTPKTNISRSPQNVSNGLETALMKFQAHQAEVNQAQLQYLQNQREYTAQFFQLLRETYSAQDLAARVTPQSNHLDNFSENGAVSYQVLADDVPNPDISPENEVVDSVQPPAVSQEDSVTISLPVEPEEIAPDLNKVEPVANVNLELLTQSLLEIVSDKTGYPLEMLELDMDLEADLGIDSIKRVEILGAMQESFPDLPPVDSEDLMELRTLAQIATYMANREAKALTDNSLVILHKSTDINGSSPTSVTKNGTNSKVEDIRRSVFNIISAKTGYAPEVIDDEMNLVTDLGVDWEGKQEIANSLASLYSELGDHAEILQLQTPEQIVEYLYSKKKSLISP
ncbi:MAG: acyltransferase domain-containing protein, partial [Cyanobacteria bacterium J06600_6]